MFFVPYPKEIEEKEGVLKYRELKAVCADKNIEKMYSAISKDRGDTIIALTENKSLKEEEYTLSVEEGGIFIEYSLPVGAYRAFTTLKLILAQSEGNSLGYIKIHDYPSLKNRGYMLDISRGRIPNLDHIKKIVDIMADMKYNQLQLYMESFVYEYKNFPEYWKDTKPLTIEEIKELNIYCKERFISLVPNQNSFGHMEVWTEKPELSHLAITSKEGKPSPTLNPLKEETLEFIDKIYDGYFDAFSADMVNIGMDEPLELGINETKEECDRVGVGTVYTQYLTKVCKLIETKYHKSPMFWDDIVFIHPEQLENLPKSATLMHWGYETRHRFDRNCSIIKKNGLKFYVCPGTSMWQSFTGRTNNMLTNVTNAAAACDYYGGEGFLLTEWGDLGHPQMPAMTYFPLIFGGCFSWDAPEHVSVYFVCGQIKQYMDKILFKTKGKKSLADIVYRMGNYYLWEEELCENATNLIRMLINTENLTDINVAGEKRALKYMQELREELNEVDADSDAMEDIIFSCDLVIFAAKLVCGIHQGLKEEKEELKERYKELWLKTSHDIGQNIFLDFLEEAFSKHTKEDK